MDELLHPRFLEDPLEYDLCVRVWRGLLEEKLTVEFHSGGWQSPWLDESWRDGNPIASAWSARARKGFRILQHTDPHAFRVWPNEFAKGDPCHRVSEIVIACALTLQSLDRVEEILRQWLVGDIVLSMPAVAVGAFLACRHL